MPDKKYSFEKIILTAIFSFAAICCILVIVFPQLRLFCLWFAERNSPRTLTINENNMLSTLVFTLPIAGLIMSGIFLFILYCENVIFEFLKKKYFIVAYLGINFIAIFIRITGFQFVSIDYRAWIIPWIEHLSQNGHFFGIATIKSDYLPFYHYLLSIISFLPKNLWLPCVKIISCLFDFLLAFIIRKIVLHIYNNKLRALTAYALILLCPTVFFNSGIWAQCESIYAVFVFLSLLYFLEKKTASALFFYGVAISIKLQAVFIFPFIVFLYFERYFTFNKLFYLFAGFISTVIIGLPFGAHIQMLKAYFKQLTGYADALTHNAPSVFALFNANNEAMLLGRIGIIFTSAIIFGMFLLIYQKINNKTPCDNSEQAATTHITLFFFCTLIVPFFLPRMHERYFYLAEIASILYAVIIPKRWYISLLIILPSCATYFNFLFGNGGSLFPLGLILMSAVILVIIWTIKEVLNYGYEPK